MVSPRGCAHTHCNRCAAYGCKCGEMGGLYRRGVGVASPADSRHRRLTAAWSVTVPLNGGLSNSYNVNNLPQLFTNASQMGVPPLIARSPAAASQPLPTAPASAGRPPAGRPPAAAGLNRPQAVQCGLQAPRGATHPHSPRGGEGERERRERRDGRQLQNKQPD